MLHDIFGYFLLVISKYNMHYKLNKVHFSTAETNVLASLAEEAWECQIAGNVVFGEMLLASL